MKNWVLLTLLCLVTLINSCKNNSDLDKAKIKPVSGLLFLDISRQIIQGKDSILLYPYEQFNMVVFDSVELGMYENLVFTILDSIQLIKFRRENDKDTTINVFSSNKKLSVFNNTFKSRGNIKKVNVKFETIEKPFYRLLESGKKYKVIYSYRSDSETLRTNVPTEHYSGYYIVDIVPVDEKFHRQIPFDYKN